MNPQFDLADLRAFVAVADLSSFRAAAEAIHLSQPALSRRIEKLERALGVRLFDRTTRAVMLTAIGRDFVRKARKLLDDLEESLLSVRGVGATKRDEVTIACLPSAVYYFLPRVISRYQETYPKIRIRILDEGANEALAAVVRGEADFGINMIGTQEPDIEFHTLRRERFVVACHRDHALARKRTVKWSDLREYDFMMIDKTSGNRLLLDHALADVSERPQWSYEAQHSYTLLGLVEADLGVAVVPELAMPHTAHPTLVSISLSDPVVTRTLGLIRRRRRPLSPIAQHLYELLKEEVRLNRKRTANPVKAKVRVR
jgi:DNA-binding transcriptional LysR family regulator